MAKVLIWQSQLAANDFPPVCAMTGRQAETWRRFSFSTAPGWSFWVGGLLAAALTARRAAGYLPLTTSSAKNLRLMTWGFVGLLPLAVALWITAAFVQSGTVAFALVVFGMAAILVAVIGLAIVRRLYAPTGKVLEPQPGYYQSLVELNNVHPAFVAAVEELQQLRAKQGSTAR